MPDLLVSECLDVLSIVSVILSSLKKKVGRQKITVAFEN